jgi:hypothetical protein
VTFAAPIFQAGALEGQVYPVRLSGLKSPANLNGVHPLQVVTTSQAIFKQPTAMLPWDGATGYGQANLADFCPVAQQNVGGKFYAYLIFDRLGERKCGRPFGLVRGRARVRPLG